MGNRTLAALFVGVALGLLLLVRWVGEDSGAPSVAGAAGSGGKWTERIGASTDADAVTSLGARLANESEGHPAQGALVRPGDGDRRNVGADASGLSAGLTAVLVSDYQPIELLRFEALELGEQTREGQLRRSTARASWPGLSAGRYLVRAWGEGWALAEVEAVVPEVGGVEVEVPMAPLNWFAGQVVSVGDRTAVRDFRLTVELASSEMEWTAHSFAVESEAGQFAVAGAPDRAETIRFVITADGYLRTVTDWIPAGGRRDDLYIELGRVGVDDSAVRAIVAGSDGGYAVGATAMIVASAATVGGDSAGDDTAGGATTGSLVLGGEVPLVESTLDVTGELPFGGAQASVGGSGGFRITTVYEGPARVLVALPSGQRVLSQPFELAHGREVDLGVLQIPSGGVIEGVVLAASEATAARVRTVAAVHSDGTRVSVALGEDRCFRFEGLTAGHYRVSAVRDLLGADGQTVGFLPVATVSVALAANDVRRVDLHCGDGMGPGAVLAGRVEGIDGLDEVRVLALTVDLAPASLCFAEPDGSFRLGGLVDGDYTLVAAGRDDAMGQLGLTWRSLSIPREGSDFVELRLDGSRIELRAEDIDDSAFRVLGETGSPLCDQLVAASLQGTLDGEGGAVVRGLPAGTYRFEIAGAVQVVELTAAGGNFALDF